jgi:hypothetical protein
VSNPQEKKPQIAVGMVKGPAGYSVVKYHILDGKIVKTEKTEPDFRVIALEYMGKMMDEYYSGRLP